MIACSASDDDDRPLGLLVGAGQQRPELVGGQEQAVALVVVAVDRHADAVEQAAGGDHDLGVALAHPVVGDHARRDAAAEQQACQPQPDVEHDLDVHPAVVAHPEPAGGVDRRHVPPRLDLIVGVDGLEQPLEPAVAARRRPHPDLGERLARRDRRLGDAGPRRPSARSSASGASSLRTVFVITRLEQHPLAQPARAISSGAPNRSEAACEDQQPGRQQAHPLGVEREAACQRRPPRVAREQLERAREAPRVEPRPGEAAQRRGAATDRDRLGRGGSVDSVECLADAGPRLRSARPAEGGSERRQSSARSPEPSSNEAHQLTWSGAVPTTSSRGAAADVDDAERSGGRVAERARRADECEPRLLLRGQHLDLQPTRAPDARRAARRRWPPAGSPRSRRRGRRPRRARARRRELRRDDRDHLVDLLGVDLAGASSARPIRA